MKVYKKYYMVIATELYEDFLHGFFKTRKEAIREIAKERLKMRKKNNKIKDKIDRQWQKSYCDNINFRIQEIYKI
jgi:hypothetical protein